MDEELENLQNNNVRFIVLGNRERLSEDLRSHIDRICEVTSANTGLNLILFLSYSGKWDIMQAARRMAHDLINEPGLKIDDNLFSAYLVTAGIPDPDLMIRTSGEKRISNYMLWQTAYSEFVFTDTLWPDFRKEQFRTKFVPARYESRGA